MNSNNEWNADDIQSPDDVFETNASFFNNLSLALISSRRSSKDSIEDACDSDSRFTSNNTGRVIVNILKELFPNKVTGAIPVSLQPMILHLATLINKTPPEDRYEIVEKLKQHVAFSHEKLTFDLVAASILKIDPRLTMSSREVPHKTPKLSRDIARKLRYGLYTPLEELLREIKAIEDSMSESSSSSSKRESMGLIRNVEKADIIRAANVHATYLGYLFPDLGVAMTGFVDGLWEFLYKRKMSVSAGIDLYNEFFSYFCTNLSECKIIDLSHIPDTVLQKVLQKYEKLI